MASVVEGKPPRLDLDLYPYLTRGLVCVEKHAAPAEGIPPRVRAVLVQRSYIQVVFDFRQPGVGFGYEAAALGNFLRPFVVPKGFLASRDPKLGDVFYAHRARDSLQGRAEVKILVDETVICWGDQQ